MNIAMTVRVHSILRAAMQPLLVIFSARLSGQYLFDLSLLAFGFNIEDASSDFVFVAVWLMPDCPSNIMSTLLKRWELAATEAVQYV